MPNFDIIRETKPQKTFRVASVMGTYDLSENRALEHFVGSIDLENDWQIGLIVGNSGTGKSTIAKELFPQAYIEHFKYTHETVLDDMPKDCSVEEITKTFSSVGFSSVTSWLKNYNVLSNGEKMRVDLARAILESQEFFVFDEFTSVVDRNVAKVGSFTMQKAIRKTKKKFIAVTCHFDVEDWLLPDWIFDTNSMTFRKCEGQKKNRPECELRIYETKQKQYYWNVFRRYHYLNHSMNNASNVYIATLNNNLCGLLSVMPFPHPKKRNFYRIHRVVVLPDYQGLGIAMQMIEYIAKRYKENGKGFIITTSHPAMINAMKKSANWRATRIGRASSGSGSGKIQNKYKKGSTSNARITASFERIY